MSDLAWLEIKKDNLISNIKILKKLAGKNVLMSPCIKANAYGHGLIETAKIFVSAGSDWLAVNSLEEAEKVRRAGISQPLLVLGYVPKQEMTKIFALDLRIFINDFASAQQLEKLGQKQNQTARIHIKIDTGMHRHGVLMDDAIDLIKKIKKLPHIKIEGLATHFATSDEPLKPDYFNKQQKNFETVTAKIKNLLADELIIHADKSASLLLGRHPWTNLVRPGLSAYGYYPGQDVAKLAQAKNIFLKPTLTFKTRIGQIKKIPAGSFVGYGCTYKTKRPTTIATIPVGYYDGYDRKLGNRGYVLVRGRRAPILGRVCMNITIIDITGCGPITSGDEVVLIGSQNKEIITVEQLAAWAETINYEIITRLREGLPRYYV